MTQKEHHNDSETAKFGMWIFIFTEIFLFGGLLIIYSVMRSTYPDEFHGAAGFLSVPLGAFNTIILLISSATVAMAISAVQKNEIKFAGRLVLVTLVCALVFLVNKYFEWTAKFQHGLYPGSDVMLELSRGYLLYFSLYFMMTGLHAVHIIIGMILLFIVFFKIDNGKINQKKYVLLENSALYWHLVDLIWIFLFPLLYLIT